MEISEVVDKNNENISRNNQEAQANASPSTTAEVSGSASADTQSTTSATPIREEHYFSAEEDEEEGSQELQDALASSNALVGENVLDSPQSPCKPKLKMTANDTNASSGHVPPSLDNDNASSDTAAATSTTAVAATLAEEEVGIMASGLAWVRRQRDRRRRLYLQNQAQQQLCKLREAQQASKNSNQSLMENATFQTLSEQQPSEAKKQPPADLGEPSQAGEKDDKEEDENDATARRQARISKSGDGYTVELDVSESNDEEDAAWIPTVRIAPEPSDPDFQTAPIILNDPKLRQQVAVHVLPRSISYCQWKRLYSLARDGDSFDACLRLVAGHKWTLLVIQTSRNEVLGGFADAPWEPQHGGAVYYGGPQACLFRIVENSNKKVLKCYKWTGANRYIQLCDVTHKMLAFGGGGDVGAFGLSVEQDFQVGSTGPCATFDNEPLCGQETFEIVDMEVYGFLVGQF